MDRADFITPSYLRVKDNFAIADLIPNIFLRAGDVITKAQTLIYTAIDFNNNSETCTVNISIIGQCGL